MSYAFQPGRLYRAPTHFGPAPGPRQRPDGGRWENRDSPHVLTAWLTLRTGPERLAAHLPPGFEPDPDPRLFIELRELRELDWLAGRGYNILHLALAVVHRDTGRAGRLSACVLESRADPIITGRDELGIPKMFADVTPLEFDGDRITGSASWDGFRFFDLALHSLQPGEAGSHGPGGGPFIHLRYVPRVGALGEADACYPVLGAVEDGRARLLRSLIGRGGARFHRASFEQLPTLFHIVNALVGFECVEVVGAGLCETRGRSDHASLRALANVAG